MNRMQRLALVWLSLIPSSVISLTTARAAPLADPIPGPIPKSAIVVELEEVASGLTAPDLVTHAGDGSGRRFVAEQTGELRVIAADGTLAAAPYLDLSPEVALPSPFTERGLLGVAFHPAFGAVGAAGAGRFYTYHSEDWAGLGSADFSVPIAGADPDHQSVVTEWTASDPGASVFAGGRRELLRIDQPQANHNAGALVFAPDGTLLIGLGDGGGADDQGAGHSAIGNAQDLSNVLGSLLRIDPLGNDSANGQYGVPGDNPFVADPNAVDEIFLYGVRNPYRFSVDVDPGSAEVTLWIGDVGQNDIEEVTRIALDVAAGANLGWNAKEGSFAFDPNGAGAGFVTDDATPAGFIDPFVEYDHDEGSSAIGGFVYRGSLIPELVGKYVFADFSAQPGLPSEPGRLFVVDLTTGELQELQIGSDDRGLDGVVRGLGQDEAGELYIAESAGFPALGTTGRVLRIAAIPEPDAGLLLGLAALLGRARRWGRSVSRLA